MSRRLVILADMLVTIVLLCMALTTVAAADSCAKWENEVLARDAVVDTITTQLGRTGGPFPCGFATSNLFAPNLWRKTCTWEEANPLARPLVGSWAKNAAGTAGMNVGLRAADAVIFRGDFGRAICGMVYRAVDRIYGSVLLNNGLIIGGQIMYRHRF